MSGLEDDQKDYLRGMVMAIISHSPGIDTSDIFLLLCYEAIYPVRPEGGPRPAPEPFAPDETDVMNCIQDLLLEQQLIMVDRALKLEKQKYRVRGV